MLFNKLLTNKSEKLIFVRTEGLYFSTGMHSLLTVRQTCGNNVY